jgi:hypothetical protein
MATKTAALNEDKLISLYMDEVLEQEVFPKSVYKFCKANKIKEEEFYKLFGSFDAIQQRIWLKFYENTHGLLEKNKEYARYSNREKMLTFFYTFFELLTLNRSYVLFVLNQGGDPRSWEQLKPLRGLRTRIKEFSSELIEEGNSDKNYRLSQRNPKIFSEGAWVQFMFLLNFWKEDQSPQFEKTDVAIEKSVNAIFDLFDSSPLETLLDFGKYLYKESGM